MEFDVAICSGRNEFGGGGGAVVADEMSLKNVARMFGANYEWCCVEGRVFNKIPIP